MPQLPVFKTSVKDVFENFTIKEHFVAGTDRRTSTSLSIRRNDAGNAKNSAS